MPQVLERIVGERIGVGPRAVELLPDGFSNRFTITKPFGRKIGIPAP